MVKGWLWCIGKFGVNFQDERKKKRVRIVHRILQHLNKDFILVYRVVLFLSSFWFWSLKTKSQRGLPSILAHVVPIYFLKLLRLHKSSFMFKQYHIDFMFENKKKFQHCLFKMPHNVDSCNIDQMLCSINQCCKVKSSKSQVKKKKQQELQ